jgi:hypothetical protein
MQKWEPNVEIEPLVDQTGPLWRYVVEIACTPIPAAPLMRARPAPFTADDQKGGA